MDKRGTLFGTASVGAILALFFGVTRSPVPVNVTTPVRREAEPSATASKSKCSERQPTGRVVRASDLMGDFFGVGFASSTEARQFARRAGWSLDAMVATLPDPIDSHLDWGFDFDLEALLRAYGRAGYVLDRFWLPWSEPKDTSDHVHCPRWRELWQVFPGIILFRTLERTAHKGSARLHLLFLVGELPTAGVQKIPLQLALADLDTLTSGGRACSSLECRRVIRLIGPLFSGSATSLRIGLDAYLGTHPKDSINVVSGSATDPGNLARLTGPRLGFAATVNSDSTLTRVLKTRVLQKFDFPPERVALLKEGSTVYGQRAVDSVGVAHGRGADADSNFLTIPFPLNVSSLRTEYQRHPELAGPRSGWPQTSGTPRLPLDLREPSGYTETPPVMSHLTPSALDLQLDRVAEVLRENRIRAVGVVGTDVRDRLFLAEEVRKRVRDIQIFTYVSNVLLASQEHGRWLRGLIVLSTYPLLSQNQAWSSVAGWDDRHRVLLSSDAAEGTYNAALAQLDRGKLALDYAPPFLSSRQNIGGPTQAVRSRPPVWISVIGRRAILPLAVDYDSTFWRSGATYLAALPRFTPNTQLANTREPKQSLFAGPLVGLVVLAGGLAVLGLLYYFWRRKTNPDGESTSNDPRQTSAGPQLSRTPAPKTSSTNAAAMRFQEILYVVLSIIALVGVIAPTLALLLRALKADISLQGWLVGLIMALALLTTIATRIFPPAEELRRRLGERVVLQKDDSRILLALEGFLKVTVVLAAVAYILLIARFSYDIYLLDDPGTILFFHRATAIDSGVSPLVPVILSGAAFTVWCIWHHQRIRLLHRSTDFERAAVAIDAAARIELRKPPAERTRQGSLDHEHRALQRASRCTVGIRAHLSKLMPDRWGGALFAVLLLVAGLLGYQTDRTMEAIAFNSIPLTSWRTWPTSFDLLFRIGILATITATAWGVYRFYRVWRSLSGCLQAITLMPLISAFERLPRRFARLSQLTIFDPPFSNSPDMTRLQERHLESLFVRCAAELGKLEKTHPGLTAGITRMMTPRQPSRADQGAHAFGDLYEVLTSFWKIEPSPKETDLVIEQVSKLDASTESLKSSTTGKLRRTFVGPLGLWLRTAEELAASQVVEYIAWVLRLLRRLALFIVVSLLLTALLISSYPFQPQSTVKLIFLMLVVTTVIALLSTLAGLSRDELLSRVNRTPPGEVTWDTQFVINVILFAAVPLLALASSEFAGLREVLFAWVEPLLKALGHG